MAREADAIAANAGGDFFVDSSCIDCDLCRQIAPEDNGRKTIELKATTSPQPSLKRRLVLVKCAK